MARRIYYIGPESKVYHTYRDCRALNNKYAYWPVHTTTGPYKPGRRLCKVCKQRGKR